MSLIYILLSTPEQAFYLYKKGGVTNNHLSLPW